ncbi:AAA family ATPase [Candidatus Woesearchaeota archaeon]|nr:AAA family ATPase [Candidatus Woesearchaeota archaeon]
MGLFDDTLKPNQNLIKNFDALEYDYVPGELPFRENEQQYLANSLKPLFHKRSGRNILIHGAPGIGKTAATKFILRELEKETDEIEPIYINCWKHNTTYKVLLEICNIIGYKFTQNKKTFDLYDVISRMLNKKAAAFVFDEIDKADELDFIYFVLEDIHYKSIFLLTNYKSWLVNLDERIKSRLLPELFEFRRYTLKETLSIMKLRKEIALHLGAIEQEAFDKIAEKTFQLKDIRSGLYLLKESALNAENQSKNKITKEHVQKAINKLDDFTIKNSEELESDSKLIYDVVKENSGKKIGDLYKIYQKKEGAASYKTFQRKIAMLEDGNYIKTKKLTGAGGNTTIVEKKLTDF